ncbi:MAG: helix-turn-helix transcriptional regulator [Lentisphaeria bacterium]|nr:helix-turn-helix transcriptional regulator [Lentisphaeria bacterium]
MKNIWRTENAYETYYINTAEYSIDQQQIRVQAFCHSFLQPQWQSLHQSRPYILVSLILSGSDAYTTGDLGHVRHSPGYFHITDLNFLSEDYRRNATETLERYFILLENTSLLQTLLKQLFPSGNYGFYSVDAPRLRKCFEDICQLLKKRKGDEALLSAMAFRLLQEGSFQQPRCAVPQELNQALLYVENHFCERELDRERIAVAAGVGISTLQRLFKVHQHCSIGEYISSLRMQKACHLLEYTGESISLIAEKCGFNYGYYFARVFKKTFGCTPAEYRKRNGK